MIGVPGLIPEADFFAHLAERRFPVTVWMRRRDELDYLVEPDLFHDFFGHLPMLAHTVFANFIQAYGAIGAHAQSPAALKMLARLYWYTVEFGLVATSRGLRAYGAGILSSSGETIYATRADGPARIAFDLQRVLRTNYLIDAYQKTYFVLDDIEQLFDSVLAADFEMLFAAGRSAGATRPTRGCPRTSRIAAFPDAPRAVDSPVSSRADAERARASQSRFSVTLRRIDLDRGERAVLRDVNWRIQPGQRWLLIGGNGAGKTQLLKLVAGRVWPKPTGRELRRYRLRGENFDTPAGVSEEIAYVGAERQDRYEHYEWNFRAREIVGTGVQRTDIPMRGSDAGRRHAACGALFAPARHRRARRAALPHAVVWRAAPRAHRARARQPAETAAARRSRQWTRHAQSRAFPHVAVGHRAFVDAVGVRDASAAATCPTSMTHLLELEQGAVRRAAAMRAAQARELLQQDSGAFHSTRGAPRANRARRSRRVLVALRNADVSRGRGAHPHRHRSRSARGAIAGWCTAPNGSGKSTLLRTYLWRSCRGGRRQHRARRHHPGCAAREVQAAHRVCRAAPADLACAEDAGDGSRGVGPLREHRPQRSASRPAIANMPKRALRRFGMLRAAPSHARRDVLWPGAARAVCARLGARARSRAARRAVCGARSRDARGSRRAGSTSGWPMAAAASSPRIIARSGRRIPRTCWSSTGGRAVLEPRVGRGA